MNMISLRSLFSCSKAAAGAEMALVTPLLMVIMFGAFEAGNFFWNQHVITNAVREGARFAGRKPLAEFDAETCAPSSSVVTDTQNVTRTGSVSGGNVRVNGWTDANSVTVTAVCSETTTAGIYQNQPAGAPVVTVTATVPYESLFGTLGFTTANLTLQANAQAAVMGF